jgi:uncharacterized protein (DUF1778 family)
VRGQQVWRYRSRAMSRRVRARGRRLSSPRGEGSTFVCPMAYNPDVASKTERLSLRLTPTQDAVLRRAAEARGESTSDYVLRHAVEAAEIDLADRRVFNLDDAAWNRLRDLLSATPSRLPPAMARLLSEPSVLERPAR